MLQIYCDEPYIAGQCDRPDDRSIVIPEARFLLIEFVHEELKQGAELRDALVKSGAVRFRPIFLTAGTAMLRAWPITLDPVFSGLAWSLIFGLLVSTAFTLVVVPVAYWLIYANRPGHGLPQMSDLEPTTPSAPSDARVL